MHEKASSSCIPSAILERPIALNGATGGIGGALAERLAKEGAEPLLLVRDLAKGEALARKLEEEHGVRAKAIPFDLDRPETLPSSLEEIQASGCRLFFHVAGIYHQEPDLSSGLERTDLVNYVEPVRFIQALLEKVPGIRIVAVSSLTAVLGKVRKARESINWENPSETLNHAGGRTMSYALSKSLMMSALMAMQEEGADIRFAHPGVSCTNLFDPKNKAYPSWFYKVAPPIMRKIFMSPSKACLSVLEAGTMDFDAKERWIGPRGLFHAWGKPGEARLPRWLEQHSRDALSFALRWEPK